MHSFESQTNHSFILTQTTIKIIFRLHFTVKTHTKIELKNSFINSYKIRNDTFCSVKFRIAIK